MKTTIKRKFIVFINRREVLRNFFFQFDWYKKINRPDYCEWIKYDDRTIIPKHHPYGDCWIIPKGAGYLKYCPYCMKLIQY